MKAVIARAGSAMSGLAFNNWAPIAAIAGVFLFGAGAAQAQSTTFAAACAGKAAGTQVSIGPFVTGISSWSITAPPGDPGTESTTYFNATWINPASTTPPEPAGAAWLSVTFPSTYVGNENYIFTLDTPIHVDPSVINPTSITVTGKYAADNTVQSVEVGSKTLSAPGGSEGSLSAFDSIATDMPTWGSLFQPGDNTLAFTVHNAGNSAGLGGANPVGLFADLSINATCVGPASMSSSPVPTLGEMALALLALALAAAGGVFVSARRSIKPQP